jgi:23S rRNA (uracil1939-C5)-methyltransferase
LTTWGRLGEAMANHDGQDVFVFGGIPGERVVAEVVAMKRKYLAARVVEVLEPSLHRVEPPCPYFGDCTGCQWQHIAYHSQLDAKREKVIDALRRVGQFADPPVSTVIPSAHQFGYRNHARFTVRPGGVLGFINRESRQFVDIDHCMLMHREINSCLNQLQGQCWETTQLSIRAGQQTGDILVQPALTNQAIPIPTGQKSYADTVAGRAFRVSSPSFFQVNVDQAANAVEVVRRGLRLTLEDVLLDAYTGVGTFAILLAPYVKKVIAVEESSAAVADARQNAGGVHNVEFMVGKSEEVLGRLSEKPDVVVMDPPRAGCQPKALQSLIELAPARVAYVSCDAETMARDLKRLCDGLYTLKQVVPLDMFPQTHHVECVALLELATVSVPLILASASPRRRELLSGLGLNFQVMPPDVVEECYPGESPQETVARLSLSKALVVAARINSGYIIAADSMVVLDRKALGKPEDSAEAHRMLRRLRGTHHQVTTGVTVLDAGSGRRLTDTMTSDITLRNFTDEEIEASVHSGTPLDKAGAYAVQDEVLRPAESWVGCYSNIVGLPLCRVGQMLEELGCDISAWRTFPPPGDCGPSCPNNGGNRP